MDYIIAFLVDGPIYEWLNDLLHLEVTKMTVAFLIASEIHSRKVKKEFGLLRESIDHVSTVLGTRLTGIEGRVEKLEKKDV